MINKIFLSELRNTLPNSYDLFICSSSFENRCLSIASNISIEKVKSAFILYNRDFFQYINTNKTKLLSIFGEKGQQVEVSSSDPLITADNLDDNLTAAMHNSPVSSILLDITTFTHESLLILMRLLQLRCPEAKITCTYSNASEYSAGDDKSHKWLSVGIGEVRSVLGYAGNIVPTRKTHLILIVGYEYKRAIGIINAIEPNSLALGYGRSDNATTEKDKEANEHYSQLVEQMATSYSNITRFEVPCNDPYKTCTELQQQINKFNDMNVLIVPMNNKLSTIGAALAAFSNQDVQICYAPALSYNYSNYSVPGDKCYVFNLE